MMERIDRLGLFGNELCGLFLRFGIIGMVDIVDMFGLFGNKLKFGIRVGLNC